MTGTPDPSVSVSQLDCWALTMITLLLDSSTGVRGEGWIRTHSALSLHWRGVKILSYWICDSLQDQIAQ